MFANLDDIAVSKPRCTRTTVHTFPGCMHAVPKPFVAEKRLSPRVVPVIFSSSEDPGLERARGGAPRHRLDSTPVPVEAGAP